VTSAVVYLWYWPLYFTGVPIPGVNIHVTTVASLNEGSGKNFQSAFGNAAYRWGPVLGRGTQQGCRRVTIQLAFSSARQLE
jgi:hypothetical protein